MATTEMRQRTELPCITGPVKDRLMKLASAGAALRERCQVFGD
jgi:hypothetical protein